VPLEVRTPDSPGDRRRTPGPSLPPTMTFTSPSPFTIVDDHIAAARTDTPWTAT
jgi:hypothetical protein